MVTLVGKNRIDFAPSNDGYEAIASCKLMAASILSSSARATLAVSRPNAQKPSCFNSKSQSGWSNGCGRRVTGKGWK